MKRKFELNQYRYLYQGTIKLVLFLSSIFAILSLFPSQGKFRYEYQPGKPWYYNDLIAPFDFSIYKTQQEIDAEKRILEKEIKPYFNRNFDIREQNLLLIDSIFLAHRTQSVIKSNYRYNLLQKKIISKIDSFYKQGIIEPLVFGEKQYDAILVIENITEAKEQSFKDFILPEKVELSLQPVLLQLFPENSCISQKIIGLAKIPNIIFMKSKTDSAFINLEREISPTKGLVQMGEKIISKGEVVNSQKEQILNSLKIEYGKFLNSFSWFYLIIIGQFVLIAFAHIVLALFLFTFRRDIFVDNKRILFILLLIFMMVFITSFTVAHNAALIYVVPLCIIPVLIRIFFDTRLALFVHIVTIILIGFLVPNSFEFLFMQLIAGIISIISMVDVRRRSVFFFTAIMIFIAYSSIYIGLILMQEGNFENLIVENFAYFGISAMLTLFAYPLIFLFEKSFGFITDISLLELADTNNKILRELSIKAPGTFQHSLQVANLAEAAVREVGGNTLLVRAGAMYHDIGKIEMPMFFIENQLTNFNPHNELAYQESAKIIISHVIRGVEFARKHKLPEEIIDFIRSHHGTMVTQYFYNMFLKNFPEEPVNKDIFTYHGPSPFSKESAILMMADSVEAASRSLQNIDEKKINDLVESIINKQIDEKQFDNADITLKEIHTIKQIFKRMLLNIFHVRIEYPTL